MIKTFEQSHAWQQSQDLAVAIYMYTKQFPDDERFGITSQMRRAVSSISANIAEGFGRRAKNDKKHFYTIAYGSLLETKNFAYLSCKLGYITEHQLNEILTSVEDIQKLINGLIRSMSPDEN